MSHEPPDAFWDKLAMEDARRKARARSMTKNLNSLRDEALRIATEHGFTDASVGEDIALMHSELSEALEAYRSGHGVNTLWYEGPQGQVSDTPEGEIRKPCGVRSELADVIIRILHFAGKHKIDIEEGVLEKMKFNETRAFKHGGKKL
jgi:NTP pyrophosphatase (non-canonical NTP hydrolase)